MNSQTLAANRHPRRILVRGVNWLGDAVMTTPALMRLREKFPAAHVALLTPEGLRDLWRHHPAVNETIAVREEEGVLAVSRKLRAGNFDVALVLPNSPRAALEMWLAKIPCRIGHARSWRNLFLTLALPYRPGHRRMRKRSTAEIRRLIAASPGTASDASPKLQDWASHQLHEYLHLAAALGAKPEPLPPQLFVSADEVEVADGKFGLAGATRPIFGLNPGAEYGPAKRWPAGSFIAAARQIQERTGCRWVILGGKGDAELASGIAAGVAAHSPSLISCVNLAGRTSLRELMAVLKLCRVLLTNDTGPMHVAAALGTPVVVPFGSTSPELTGPGLPGDARHRLLKSAAPCAPCFLRECPIDFRCMTGIAVKRVVEAVISVVGQEMGGGR